VVKVDLYYDAEGNVIQENSTPAGGSPAVTQYVLSAASPGSIIERDDTSGGSPERVWCFQDHTGSTIALYQDGSGGDNSIENILYTPTGVATFIDGGIGDDYYFSDDGAYNWRYLWQGGREAMDQNVGYYTSGVVDTQSGFISINGTEFDTTNGTPLLQDKYAFFRPSTGSGELPINANEFSSRDTVDSQLPGDGSESTWSDAFLSDLAGGGGGGGTTAPAVQMSDLAGVAPSPSLGDLGSGGGAAAADSDFTLTDLSGTAAPLLPDEFSFGAEQTAIALGQQANDFYSSIGGSQHDIAYLNGLLTGPAATNTRATIPGFVRNLQSRLSYSHGQLFQAEVGLAAVQATYTALGLDALQLNVQKFDGEGVASNVSGYGLTVASNAAYLLSYQSPGLTDTLGPEVIAGGILEGALDFSLASAAESAAIPGTFARVVPGAINPTTLGVTEHVFVTDAALLRGLNAAQIAEQLEIPAGSSFKIIEFSSEGVNGIAVPIRSTSPGFIGRGFTSGGLPEFTIPNGPIPPGSVIRSVP
jgi:hypothetical protein